MRRQEVLLNLTLLVIIGALLFFIYESREMPRGLEELPTARVSAETAAADGDGAAGTSGDEDAEAGADANSKGDEDEAADEASDAEDAPPGAETSYSGRPGSRKAAEAGDSGDDADKTVADAGDAAKPGSNRGGQFGARNIFRALLTPTPTPPPPTPTPAPTPDIAKALGAWRLLSVYQGKAMIEDVQKSAAGEEGAIWEMPPGGTKQVDVGDGQMKTATLKAIEAENPYNPEVTFGLEGTKEEKKINLDTEPAAAAPAPAPKK